MSNRYKGGVISATPPTTTGGESGTASGAWTLEQQMQAQAAGLWPSPPPPLYIENVFSTYLYTGNGSTQTIANGIDLSTKGGMVWSKVRNNTFSNALQDTVRGPSNILFSNSDVGNQAYSTSITSFGTTGYTLGNETLTNQNTGTFVGWTFRKQPKFFDVVTYTGNGTVKTVNHNLGSVPGVMIVKCTSAGENWAVYHRSLGATKYLELNNTNAASTSVGSRWDAEPTSTSFSVGYNGSVNSSGATYVAYLFAHDAGGFGLTDTDNVISCGSLVSGSVQDINLGYEPQWIMYKNTGAAGPWGIFDNMRGMPTDGNDAYLVANTNAAEATASSQPSPLATGFRWNYTGNSGQTFIYVAIRRGPMAVPTSGTSVFSPVTTTGTGTNSRVITGVGFSPDMIINCTRGATTLDRYTQDRLRGVTPTIYTNSTSAEQANQGIYAVGTLDMTGFTQGTSAGVGFNSASDTYVFYNFKRTPSFFDEVCYTGTGTYGPLNHNLGVIPEWIIGKPRSATGDWIVIYLNSPTNLRYVTLNSSSASANWGTALNTSTEFYGTDDASGTTYVSYLFATCPGVSKVGSYTGNGSSQTINCGFVAGARFVLIKRTDSTGSWYVWDTARGMVAGTDPLLMLNSAAAEVNANLVYTVTTGFQLVSGASDLNANGGTYIFLAIA